MVNISPLSFMIIIVLRNVKAFSPLPSLSPFGVSRCSTRIPCRAQAETIDRNGFFKSSTLLHSMSSDQDSDSDADGGKGIEGWETVEELTTEKISEMIEVTFVNACMQLAQGYVDVLKLFIVAVKAAYESGISITDLSNLVDGCENQSANRPLMQEEVDLRLTWMSVVYMTLETLGHASGPSDKPSENIKADTRDKFGKVVDHVLKTEGTVQTQSVEALMESGGFSQATESNPMEQAILKQSMRVVVLTLNVIEEEKVCLEDGERIPSPNIPGTT